MFKKNTQAIVLAAGKSTRFNTGNTKLLNKICGQEMVLYATKLLEKLAIPTTLVVGHQKELIEKKVIKHHGTNITFAEQAEQKGTGHAILCAKQYWNQDSILVMNGDMPLVTAEIIENLYKEHATHKATISFVTAHNIDPLFGGYGRVMEENGILKIVEAADFKGDPNEHYPINAGIYLIERAFLETAITKLTCNNKKDEFYITDLIGLAGTSGHKVVATVAPFDHVRGINNFKELWIAEQIQRAQLIQYWMDRGVRFSGAQNIHIDLDVEIGAGTNIGFGAQILNGTRIGKNCELHEFSRIEHSTVAEHAKIYSHCIVKNATIGEYAEVGPFAHIREKSVIKDHAVVGNFVEVKNSTIGCASHAKHLSYLGDATIGNNVNIGAGTITCNYDGEKKHKTIIKDDAFIGSNTAFVAPVTVGKGALTAAGSTITHDVPAGALGIARSRQTNKEDYEKNIITKENDSTVIL